MSEDPRSEWKATRRRGAVRLWLGGGAILAAALLAALNAYVVSAWYDRPECCYLFALTDDWANVILVLSAIGALIALLAGIAVARVMVKGTRFFEVHRAAGPWIVLGLLTSAGLFYLSICLPWWVAPLQASTLGTLQVATTTLIIPDYCAGPNAPGDAGRDLHRRLSASLRVRACGAAGSLGANV